MLHDGKKQAQDVHGDLLRPGLSLLVATSAAVQVILSTNTLPGLVPGPARVVRPLLPVLTHPMVLDGRLVFYAQYRYPLVARPDQAIGGCSVKHMKHSSETLLSPILLIHAQNDPFISLRHAHRLVAAARAAGRVIDEYYTPCAIHCGSYGYNPRRYMALLQQFMALESGPTP